LPSGISKLEKLRLVKLEGNPLEPKLQAIAPLGVTAVQSYFKKRWRPLKLLGFKE